MAGTKYLFLLMTVGVSLNNIHEGIEALPLSNNLQVSVDAKSENLYLENNELEVAKDIVQQIFGKVLDDQNSNVKYEIQNAPPQQDLSYGDQLETFTHVDSSINETQLYNLNKLATLSSNVLDEPPSVPTLQYEESTNSFINQMQINPLYYYRKSNTVPYHHPGIYLDTHETTLSAQTEPLLLSNANTYYPPLFPNYQNFLLNPPQFVAPTSPTWVSESPIPVEQDVQSALPSLASVAIKSQLFNIANGLNNYQAEKPISANIAQKPTEPIVTKDFYYHTAPPDDVETNPAQVLAPKKNYKIIFIKLPTYELRNSAVFQNIYKKNVAAEDKTLIYVLVKKADEQALAVPHTTPSQHEVIFVKYKENKQNPVNIVHNVAKQILNDTKLLQRGLLNGH